MKVMMEPRKTKLIVRKVRRKMTTVKLLMKSMKPMTTKLMVTKVRGKMTRVKLLMKLITAKVTVMMLIKVKEMMMKLMKILPTMTSMIIKLMLTMKLIKILLTTTLMKMRPLARMKLITMKLVMTKLMTMKLTMKLLMLVKMIMAKKIIERDNASKLNLPKPIVIITKSPHPPPKTIYRDCNVPYPSLLPLPHATRLPNKVFNLWPFIKSINHKLEEFSKSTNNVIFLNPMDVFIKTVGDQERMVNNPYMNKYYPSPQGYAV